MYLRTVKVRSSSGAVNQYVRVVEAYRDNGKVKQRTVADLGRRDLLDEMFPKLKRLLGYEADSTTPRDHDPDILDASTWGPVLALRALFDQLGLWTILDAALGKAKGVPFADRAFVLIANRLTRPASEHGLAGWLETDFVCDRRGRRFVPHWHQHKRVRVHFRFIRRRRAPGLKRVDMLAPLGVAFKDPNPGRSACPPASCTTPSAS